MCLYIYNCVYVYIYEVGQIELIVIIVRAWSGVEKFVTFNSV